MLLKPKEICKWKNKCPYVGMGKNKCFGVRGDREEIFNCHMVEENGKFKPMMKYQRPSMGSKV